MHLQLEAEAPPLSEPERRFRTSPRTAAVGASSVRGAKVEGRGRVDARMRMAQSPVGIAISAHSKCQS